MPGQEGPARTPPVIFDEAAWAQDMLRASAPGRDVAHQAREEFESRGVLIDRLRACEPEGDDGPQPRLREGVPTGVERPHGMVFEINRIGGRLRLLFAAFGLRHPARETRQPSVYAIAYRRLNRRSAG